MLRAALILFAALFLLVTVFALFNATLVETTRAKDLSGIAQSLITAFAIVAGGIFAYYKLQLFRDFEPHLTISHAVSHRFLGDYYVHIAVTANLYNSSRVKMELSEGFFSLQQLAPLSAEEVERLYAQVFVDREYEYFQWPLLDETPRDWDNDKLIIEPGGAHQETCEFLVSEDVESVLIYTYFYGSADPQASHGWDATTIYDIPPVL